MTNAKMYLFIILLTACVPSINDCKKEDKACFNALLERHEIRNLNYWDGFFQKPLNKRVFLATEEMINYLQIDNMKHGYPNKPAVPQVSPEFIEDIKDAISEIPMQVKLMLEQDFAGVFLVKDLGGTGYADYIYDKRQKPYASFVVLDYEVLNKRSANEWASWKESTPFIANKSFSIEAKIEEEQNDNKKYAIQYILLHEFGHVLSTKRSFHPRWDLDPNEIDDLKLFPFANLSWQIDKNANKYTSRFDQSTFSSRKDVIYYFGAKIDAKSIESVYHSLEQTNFPTLYAATNPYDDWAESFASYVHSELMGKPFSITINKNGKPIKKFNLCWQETRCAKKRAYLNKIFKKNI